MASVAIDVAPIFRPLLGPSRYKGAHGGRGSGKSQFFADLAVASALRKPGFRLLCCREVQKSLKESAHRLISDKISSRGLGAKFDVQETQIKTPGGGLIVFTGLQDHTAESVKSYEAFDAAWVEEAQTVSARSLSLLRPTIRKPGSELWFSWNPRKRTDAVDVMLRGAELPTSAQVVQANWSDNPWFPPELEQERQDCLRMQPDQYSHIWEGDYVTVSEGAYYARDMALAKEQGRIGFVPEDPHLIIRLFADIGGTGAKADNFVFWAVQFVGLEIRIVNHYEVQGQPIAAHLNWMRSQGYSTDRCKIWLPHDGDSNDRVFDVSYRSAFEAAGYEVEVVPNQGKGAAAARIEEARKLFPRIRFDDAKTEAGRMALGWYHEKKDEKRNIGLGPNHDWASHSADAFGLICIVYEEPAAPIVLNFGSGAWMAA